MKKRLLVLLLLTIGPIYGNSDLTSGHVGTDYITLPLEINFDKKNNGTPCTGGMTSLGSSGGYSFYDFTDHNQYCYFYTLLLCPSGNDCINTDGTFTETYLSRPSFPYRAHLEGDLKNRSIKFKVGDSKNSVKDRNEVIAYTKIETARNYELEFDLKLNNNDTFPPSDEWFMLMQVRQNGTEIASPPLSIDLKEVGGVRHLQIAGRSRPQLWGDYERVDEPLDHCSYNDYVYQTGVNGGTQCKNIAQTRVVYYDLNLDSTAFNFDKWNKIKLHFRMESHGDGWIRAYIDNSDNSNDNYVLIDTSQTNGFSANLFMGDSEILEDEKFTMKFGIYRGGGTADATTGVFRKEFNVHLDNIKLSRWGW